MTYFALLLAAGSTVLFAAEPPPPGVAPADLNSSASLTNLVRPVPRKDGLKLLEEELSKSLQPFSSKNSVEGLLAPGYTPPLAAPTTRRRTKEDDEAAKKWIFDLDEKNSKFGEDVFKLPGFDAEDAGRKGSGKNNPVLEEFMQALNPSAKKGGKPAKPSASEEDSLLPTGIRETAKSLRQQLLGTDRPERIFNPGAAPEGLSSIFQPQEDILSRNQAQERKESIDRFKQVLEGGPSLANQPQDLGKALVGLDSNQTQKQLQDKDRQPGYLGTVDSLRSTTKPDAPLSTPGNLSSVLHPNDLPDVNSKTLNGWNLLYTVPKTDLPKPAFFSPPVEAPRRRF